MTIQMDIFLGKIEVEQYFPSNAHAVTLLVTSSEGGQLRMVFYMNDAERATGLMLGLPLTKDFRIIPQRAPDNPVQFPCDVEAPIDDEVPF